MKIQRFGQEWDSVTKKNAGWWKLGNKLEWFQTKQKRWLDKPQKKQQEKSCNVPAKMWTLPYIASEWNDGFDQESDPMNQAWWIYAWNDSGGQINMLVERQIFFGFIPINWHNTITCSADTPFFPILSDSQ